MKIIVLFAFLTVCLCVSLTAGEAPPGKDNMIYYQRENARFYSCTPLGTPGTHRFVAVGELAPGAEGSKRPGYIAVLLLKDGKLSIESEDRFHLEQGGRKWSTRVRTAAVVSQPGSQDIDIYISGKGGNDERGIGYLRHYTWANNLLTLTPTQTIILRQEQEGIVYTHGYSLKTGDIDGDGEQEVIWGGFFGKDINEHLSEDFADIRVFKKNPKGVIAEAAIKPFAQLPIPLRVNALEVKDMDGDAKAEIIIAGRSRQGDHEYSAFAIWSGGHLSYHVDREKSLPGRIRTVMAVDIDSDGKDELITGGRIDMGERMVADLQIWKLKPASVSSMARYNWTSDASTRLRALAPTLVNGQFIAVGRTELRHSGDSLHWIGFIRRFQFKNGSLWPMDLPFLLDKGPDTRIRDIRSIGPGRYLYSGFFMNEQKESTGFVLIL